MLNCHKRQRCVPEILNTISVTGHCIPYGVYVQQRHLADVIKPFGGRSYENSIQEHKKAAIAHIHAILFAFNIQLNISLIGGHCLFGARISLWARIILLTDVHGFLCFLNSKRTKSMNTS